jgi:hypothetical protein
VYNRECSKGIEGSAAGHDAVAVGIVKLVMALENGVA